jgi:diguanylate cyclase (GGDEF)-like protein
VLTVRCDPPDHDEDDEDAVAAALAFLESLELFVSQAGASLHNARVHRGLEQLKDRLDHEASHDALTDLANRRRFADELDRTAGRGRADDLLAVLFVDLDGFKDVNDRYGHETGNDLLVAVANRLRDCVRPGDLVARMGGDEFTVMLTRLQTIEPAAAVAERICAALSEPFTIGSRDLRISTSVGVALAPADRADGADLLRRADTAMYRAKSNGKARWSMDTGPTEKTLEIAAEIHASVQGTCHDAPRTSQRRMEEM